MEDYAAAMAMVKLEYLLRKEEITIEQFLEAVPERMIPNKDLLLKLVREEQERRTEWLS